MENCLKAINLDIRQMKYLITEKNTFLKVETYKKHIKNEDKGKNSTIKNESLETMTTSFSQEERENIRNTNNRNTNNIALNYAIDEKIQISEKGYHCHVCQIF